MKNNINEQERIIWGHQVVIETLKAGNATKVFILQGRKDIQVQQIMSLASSRGVPYYFIDSREFEKITGAVTVMGKVAAYVLPLNYLGLEEFLTELDNRESPLLVLFLDHLNDPHNVGALMRVAEAVGVEGVVIPRDRSVGITSTVRRVSAGAAEWLSIVQVTNLARTVELFQERGFWIYGAEEKGSIPYWRADWKRRIGLILGSEGRGLSRLVQKKCDQLISIPMVGNINSLNVAVAGGIFAYEFFRQKNNFPNFPISP